MVSSAGVDDAAAGGGLVVVVAMLDVEEDAGSTAPGGGTRRVGLDAVRGRNPWATGPDSARPLVRMIETSIAANASAIVTMNRFRRRRAAAAIREVVGGIERIASLRLGPEKGVASDSAARLRDLGRVTLLARAPLWGKREVSNQSSKSRIFAQFARSARTSHEW